MKKSEYAKYLQTDHWQQLRKEVIEATPFCEKCEVPRWLSRIAYDQDLHVHHLSYANLGCEDWLDLQVLCRYCHEVETFGRTDLVPVKSARCEHCGERHYDVYSKSCRTCQRLFDPPELYSLLEVAVPGNPAKALCFEAIDTACALLRRHGVTAESLGKYIVREYERIEQNAKKAAEQKDEVPF